MRTLPYDHTVGYIKGSANQIADWLSRLGPLEDKFKLPILEDHEITGKLQATSSRIQLLHQTTVQDNDLCSIKDIVQAGCQAKYNKCHCKFSPVVISVRRLPLKMLFYSKGQELLYLQAKGKTYSNSSMQVIFVYQNTYIEPNQLYYMTIIEVQDLTIQQV